MFRWLDLFTAEEKLRHPAMILIAGFPAFVGGAQADAWRPLVDAALDLQVGDDPMPWGSTTMRAFQTMLRAAAARDGMTRFAEDAELAATFAAHDEPGVRAGNDSILGAAQWLSGRKAEARRTLRRAVEEGASYNLLALLGALGCLSTMAADDGDWEEAEACATRAAQRLEEEEMGLVNPLVIVPLAEARVLAHNHDPAAEERIRVVVRVMDRPGMIWWLALLTEAILGEIALEQGDFATAARWARSGKRRLEVWPDAGLLGPRLERLERALERACLVEPLTPAERRLLELLPSHMSLGEIAARLWVSRETVKTEIASLYRKLGVHSRSESVAKARDCGLLRQR
jgi:LuxR family maltose regulon positive regulatory protein